VIRESGTTEPHHSDSAPGPDHALMYDSQAM